MGEMGRGMRNCKLAVTQDYGQRLESLLNLQTYLSSSIHIHKVQPLAAEWHFLVWVFGERKYLTLAVLEPARFSWYRARHQHTLSQHSDLPLKYSAQTRSICHALSHSHTNLDHSKSWQTSYTQTLSTT